MKIKLYTRSHNLELLKQVDNNGQQFTAQEHAYVIEKEFSDIFNSKESLLHWYLSRNPGKLNALAFLIRYVNENKFTYILSLGAGYCVLEYLLSLAMPTQKRVIAADFDAYMIEKVKLLFPNIIPVVCDFFSDDLSALLNTAEGPIDIAVFFGSSYVMDDEVFINTFCKLRWGGVKRIVDFHGGYQNMRTLINNFFVLPLKESAILRRLFGKPLVNKGYIGKFHGYGRTRSELRKLYLKSGFTINKEISVSPYKYVAILHSKKR